MENNILDFLKTIQFYPVNDETWGYFFINHFKPIDLTKEKATISLIKEKVGKKSGIYIYVNDKDEILYIGKAKFLYDRLKSHYIECFRTVPGDTKDNRWHRFFSNNQGILKVYWKNLDEEAYRQLVELMLTTIKKPKFLDFK